MKFWHLLAAMMIALFVAITLPTSAAMASPNPGSSAGQRILAKEEAPEPDDNDEESLQDEDEESEESGEDDGGKKKRYAIIGGTGGGLMAALGAMWIYIRRARTAYKLGRGGYRLYKWHRRRRAYRRTNQR